VRLPTRFPVRLLRPVRILGAFSDGKFQKCRSNSKNSQVAQYEQRACLAETEARVYVEQLDQLTHFQQRLEAIWRSARWISNFASVARDRGCAHRLALLSQFPKHFVRRFCSLPLTRLLRPADEPTELLGRDRLPSVLGSKRNGLLPPPLSPLGALALAASAQSQSCASSPAFNAKKLLDAHWVAANGNGGANSLPSTPSQPRLSATAADENGHSQFGQVSSTAGNGQQCAVLRVFVAFEFVAFSIGRNGWNFAALARLGKKAPCRYDFASLATQQRPRLCSWLYGKLPR